MIRRVSALARGIVQGVGFRPFVYRIALAHGLVGWVRNGSDGVRIVVQGDTAAIDAFLDDLQHRLPPQAAIDSLAVVDIAPETDTDFRIVESAVGSHVQPAIPADMAICDECRQEIATPGERRHGYPFTNCTQCGPRYTIIEGLPYDRPRTAMRAFPLCDACAAQYRDPLDRRFHAQPIACPDCGPHFSLLSVDGQEAATRDDALRQAADAVLAGRILALKGLGGFQLLVDATNEAAVARLRQRKLREAKPFAVMFPSLEALQDHAEVTEAEMAALTSVEAPILLVRKRGSEPLPLKGAGGGGVINGPVPLSMRPPERGTDRGSSTGQIPVELPDSQGSGVADPTLARPFQGQGMETATAPSQLAHSVAPSNPRIGAMLPYTPLHVLLMARIGRPVVCTSGNLSDEPMVIDTSAALAKLGPIADVLLVHDRPVVRPVDDSVAQIRPDGLALLRRARGFAPKPLRLRHPQPTTLALGAHLKSTVALSIGDQAIVSQHLGDLQSVEGASLLERTVTDLLTFFEAQPEIVACDLHPDYVSTRLAEALAAQWQVPLVRVQHHHAHIAAAMAEFSLNGPVLGLAWDGTGYGTDGTVWGGEALVCEGASFQRVAHLRPFPLPGGERAIREPRRSALGALHTAWGDAGTAHAEPWFTPGELATLVSMVEKGIQSPRTSSVGRLFDAVAALTGVGLIAAFEGQPAMALEYAAEGIVDDQCYPLPLSGTLPAIADWQPLLEAIRDDQRNGVPTGVISARFHNTLADLAVALAQRVGLPDVVLSGGCFQNRRLVTLTTDRLSREGFRPVVPRQYPPNDGGIALGQLFVAGNQQEGTHVSRHPR